MRNLAIDLRDSLRSLRRDRGFSATVILTLALTIGATTAAFSIVNGVLLKPLAYPQPDRLVALKEIWTEVSHDGAAFEVNERHFEYWRENSTLFEAMAQYITQPANLTSGGPATEVNVVRASGSLFDVLGRSVQLGRVMSADDDRAGSADVAILGDALWRKRFGANPSAIGNAIVLDGTPFTVIGILSPDFRLPERERLRADVDAIVPLRLTAGWVGDHNNAAIGRLKAGVTLEQARAELEVLQRQVGAIATERAGQPVTLLATVRPLVDTINGRARSGIVLLFGAILGVLAIACANLTNLALIRALARAKEGAIRTALGAGRRRLAFRAILDHAVLALIGGAAGLWLAFLALRAFVLAAPVDLPRLEEVTIDARVFGFAILVTVTTAVLVSVLPVWHLGDRDPQDALRGGSAAGQGRGSLRARAVLTGVQVALSVTLLTVTALLGTSLWHVLKIDFGFRTDGVLSLPVALPAARYGDDRSRVAAYDRILAAVKSVPGVRSASSTSMMPMRGEGQVNFVVAAGTNVPRSEQPSANFRFIGPEYFATLELPVVRGRSFTTDERDNGRVMPSIVSASLAERLWPDQDALGKEFSRGIDGEPGFAVIGIAADARTTSLESTPPLMVYVPYWWRSRATLSLLVKTTLEPTALASSIRRTVEQIDPEIAVGQALPLQQAVDAASAGRRFQARLFVMFGVASLLIAALGVYAVTAYSLSKRRREMNIRVALGAHRNDVVRLFVTQASTAVIPGVAAGIAGALALGGAIASLLYEVRPRDPVVLAGVAMTVTAAAIAAALFATLNGVSLDPAAALRDE